MASASRLYRLVAGLALLGVLAAAASLAVALDRTALSLPPADALLGACRRLLPAGVSALALPILALAGLGLLVVLRALRSTWRHFRAERRFRSAVRPCGELDVQGTRVALVDDEQPRAFCAGYLRPRIHLSSGAQTQLSEPELEAVIAHERHHVRRRDPLRLLVARVLADALFFLPALRRLGDRYAALSEVAADEAAARVTGPSTLASALLAFNGAPSAGVVVGIAPERVDQLLGEPPGWEVPASILLGALVTLAGLVSVIVGVMAFAGARVDLSMLLAQSCMLLMCGAAAAAAVAGLFLRRRRIARRYTGQTL